MQNGLEIIDVYAERLFYDFGLRAEKVACDKKTQFGLSAFLRVGEIFFAEIELNIHFVFRVGILEGGGDVLSYTTINDAYAVSV